MAGKTVIRSSVTVSCHLVERGPILGETCRSARAQDRPGSGRNQPRFCHLAQAELRSCTHLVGRRQSRFTSAVGRASMAPIGMSALTVFS